MGQSAGAAVVRGRRVIDKLRTAFPGMWTYDAQRYAWDHHSGWYVYRESALAPKYDGDDDSFVTHYRRSDTGERLYLDWPSLKSVTHIAFPPTKRSASRQP